MMHRRMALAAAGAMLMRARGGALHLAPAARQQRDPLPADAVRDFVRAAHADLPAVRAALASQPALANACLDWGAGDFETALGAASHMGRRDIADALVAAGARVDLFTMVVLRDLDLLYAQLQRHPALVLTKGPHGLTFEAHARATKDPEVERRVTEIVVEARAALR